MPAALITGAAIRIGQALAQRLAERGYDIALHHHASDPAVTLENCRAAGVRCQTYQADLTGLPAVEGLIGRVQADFPDLEVLINSAANFIQENVESTSLGTLEKSLRGNLMAPFLLMRDYKRRVNRGLIVNILDERIGRRLPAFAAYSVSKVGLAHLTRLAAVEWGETVRVNGIAPGLILPPQGQGGGYLERNRGKVPMQRHGSVADLMRGLDYLLDSPFVNGEILFIDGGENLTGALKNSGG
ncbi:MAG: SDR family oxidoreductase [Nitrospinaceae bacterium]